MFNILFSYAKPGVEGDLWERELRAVRTEQARFVPFNHRKLLGNVTYASAFQLDMDFRARNRGLVVLYRELERTLRKERIDCLFVTNDNPYHPDFLKTLDVYRAYHTTDDPGASYTRTFPYVHAFDHLFHCAIPYSPTQTLAAKLREVGARRVDFLPLGVFDFEIDPTKTSTSILEQRRDIDEGLQDAPHLVARRASRSTTGRLELVQKPQLDHLVDRGLDLVDQPGLIRTIGQEHPHQFHDVVTTEYQACITTPCVEFGQFLAQQRK